MGNSFVSAASGPGSNRHQGVNASMWQCGNERQRAKAKAKAKAKATTEAKGLRRNPATADAEQTLALPLHALCAIRPFFVINKKMITVNGEINKM